MMRSSGAFAVAAVLAFAVDAPAAPTSTLPSAELVRGVTAGLPVAVAAGGLELSRSLYLLNQPGIRIDDPATAAVLTATAERLILDSGLGDANGEFTPPEDSERLMSLSAMARVVLTSKLGEALSRQNPALYARLLNDESKMRRAAASRLLFDGAAGWKTGADAGDFDPEVEDGVAHVTWAFDVGASVDLSRAAGLLSGSARTPLQPTGPAPSYFNFKPAPLTITRETAARLPIDRWETASAVEVILYEIGVIQVNYRIPFSGRLSELAGLSELLHENRTLQENSRALVAALVAELGAAVTRPLVAEASEDYVIFQIRRFVQAGALDRLLAVNPAAVAQILRADPKLSSPQEVADALSTKVSYADGELAVPDWAAAVVVDPDGRDVRAVLEFAIVQLLEMRLLDARLDDELAAWRKKFAVEGRKPRLFFRAGGALNKIGELLIEGAMIKEGISNALKLIGDQYLARLYDQAAKRFHLAAWSDNVEKKLATLESIHDKMEHAHSTNHQTRLEWIVILLILVEVVLSLLRFH